MNPIVRASAIPAIKWAFVLCSGFILGPVFIGIAGGVGISGDAFAEKLVVGILLLPILFAGFWFYGIFTCKDPLTGLGHQPPSSQQPTAQSIAPPSASIPSTLSGSLSIVPLAKKPSVWNYVWIGVGTFMLLFMFLPQAISGTLASQYYLGAAIWVGIIIYCLVNISRAKGAK